MTDTKNKDPHAELMRLAMSLAHVYSFVGGDEMPIAKNEFDAYARTLTDRIAELEAQLEAVGAGGVGAMMPVRPSHRCKVCGALWKFWSKAESGFNHDSWSLRSATCGKCCDMVPMGDQIEPLTQPAPAIVEPTLPTDKEIASVIRGLPEPMEPVARWALSCDDIWFIFSQFFAPEPKQIAEPADEITREDLLAEAKAALLRLVAPKEQS